MPTIQCGFVLAKLYFSKVSHGHPAQNTCQLVSNRFPTNFPNSKSIDRLFSTKTAQIHP
jgi:hypothetical protein